MGNKNKGITGEAVRASYREIINFVVLSLLFIGYALTFTVPKFYGATDSYVGVFVFCMLIVLLFNNVNVFGEIKKLNKELIVMAVLVIVTGANLLIVNSGKGAFFVAVNFALIFYLSDKLVLSRRLMLALSGMYMGLIILWLFVIYPKLFTDYTQYGYNTNTAATFTIYTMLCAFMFLEQLLEKSEFVGLFMVIILIKGLQLSLWHRARGAFIMLILFVLFRFIIPKKWWSIKKLYCFLILFMTLGSLLFVSLYVWVGSKGVNFQMPFFYKNVFSGRDAIWYEFFSLFIKKPLTGIGTNVTIESFFEFNVHNAMYNFLVIHGIIVFALILYFVYKRFQGMRKIILNNSVALSAMCALTAVFFESFFDVDLIWADYSLNLMLLLCVINSYKKDTEIK